jgi:predicted peptidase
VDVDWSADTHTLPAEPSEPLRLALALVGALQGEFSIDSRQIYVTGLSMGGYGTWDAAMRRPDLFAAAVPVCGGADETKAARIAKMPIWVFHGARDPVVKVARSDHMIAALLKAGGNPGYTRYPGEEHASWDPAYRDPELFKWLFAQKRD